MARSANAGAYGAVCRDSSGLYMGSSAIKCSDATLEALACREAMALAKDLSLGNIVVASNWKEVIQDIKSFFGGKHASFIREIIKAAAEFQSCSFIFEERETNIEAHGLAKFALNLSIGRHLWLGQPPDIQCITVNSVLINKVERV